MDSENKEWQTWGVHVLAELKRLDAQAEKTNKMLADIRLEIALLKVKSGLWGLAGAALPIVIMIGVQFLIK